MVQIGFYCGVNEKDWNHQPVMPGPLACIAPVYGRTEKTRTINRIRVPENTRVIQDSGAFSDGPNFRLSFAQALLRQIKHARQFGYINQVSHVASYDLLIDERWEDGARFKERWAEDTATLAIKETVAAAQWIAQRRRIIERKYPSLEGLILSAQGVTPEQYLQCAESIFGLFQTGDILGLGGWCITGKMPAKMLPVLSETMQKVIPAAAKAGITRAHIWGVIYPPALAWTGSICERHGINLSTDSAGPTMNPVFGEWGYGEWRDRTYQRQPVAYRGLHRIKHVRMTRRWLANFPAERHLKNHQSKLF